MCDLSALAGAWLKNHINEWTLNVRPQTYWMGDEWMLWHYFPAHFPFCTCMCFKLQAIKNSSVWDTVCGWHKPHFELFTERQQKKKIIFKKKSFIQTTHHSHKSQALLIEQDGPNTVKKKWKINLSSMRAIDNTHVYISSQDLHLSMRERFCNSNRLVFFLNTLLACVWHSTAKCCSFIFLLGTYHINVIWSLWSVRYRNQIFVFGGSRFLLLWSLT